METVKTLITSGMRLTPEQRQRLEEAGFELVISDSEKEVPQEAVDAEIVVCNSLFRHVEPDQFPKLKFVQLTSAGMDGFPADYFREKGIGFANAAGVFVPPMTEWALLYILHFYRCADLFRRRQEDGVWEKPADQLELEGKTATIVGYGAVGAAIGEVLRHFGVHVIAVSRSRKQADRYLPLDKLNEAISESDIVIVSIAAAPGTEKLVDREALQNLKSGAVFLNLSRGSVVDQDALIERVQEGDLRGVALDVFEEEPLPADSSLWGLPGVVITPHVSFYSDRIKDRLFQVVWDNLNRYYGAS